MYDKSTNDSGRNGAKRREGNEEEIREKTLCEDGGEILESETEEIYFDKETGYWVGTGNFRKRKKVIDPDEAYENARDN